jgi:hypothetical protein
MPDEQQTLQMAVPGEFERFVVQFDGLLERCVEHMTYRVPMAVSNELSDMAEQLGVLRAGPRDIVEIYGTSLKRRLSRETKGRYASFAGAGQLVAFELMGYLVSYYRNQARLTNPSYTLTTACFGKNCR